MKSEKFWKVHGKRQILAEPALECGKYLKLSE